MFDREISTQWHGQVRELQAAQLYHWQWHLLRMMDASRHAGCDVRHAFRTARVRVADWVVLGCFVDGHIRGAVRLRWVPSANCQRAEVAFSVERRWQGRGIGTALMAAAIAAARARGFAHLHLTCHALNHRMQSIAESFGAVAGFEGCEYFADLAIGEDEPVA